MTAFEDSRRIEGREMSTSGYWSRLRSRNLSRRALLRASARAGVGAAGLALVGCGDDDDDDGDTPSAVQAERQQQEQQDQPARQQAQQQQQAAAQTEQQGEQQAERQAAAQDQQEQQAETAETETAREEAATSEVDLDAEITVGYGSFPPTLDITTAGGGGGQGANNNLHFAALGAYNSGRQLQRSGGFGDWEFAEGNSVFRWTIKRGVTFHNGEPLNAESVKFYFDRILGRAEYNPDFQSQLAARAAWMGDIRLVDEDTVEIAMDPPFVDAGEQSGGINFGLLPMQYIIDNGDDHFANNPVGCGAYKFVSWVPDGEIRSERFEEFAFGRDAPYQWKAGWAKYITGRFFPEEQARAAALEAGEIDIAYRISPDVASQFEDREDFKVIALPDVRVMAIELPVNGSVDPITGEANPWRDIRVRRAANYAIDAEAIINNLLTGTEDRAYSPFPAGKPPPLGSLEAQYNYDPERARALLEEAGQVGFAFKITLPTGLWTADRIWMPAVQQMLNDVGFQVEIDYADFGNALALMRNNELPNPFIFNQAGVNSGAPLGSAFAYRLVTTVGAPYSHAQATDDFLPEFVEFQALIDEANVEFDAERANDLFYEASVISYENAFQVPLFGLPHLYAVTPEIFYNEYYGTSTGLNPIYAQKVKSV